MNVNRLLLVIILISSTFLMSKDHYSSSHTITIVFPKTALLDIESVVVKNISSNLTSPLEVANPMATNSKNRIWLDVTSIVGSGDTRNISAKVETQISGFDLKVVTDRYSGSAFSSSEILQNEITLTTNDQILVSGIESGYTTNGINNGFNLKYMTKNNNSKFGEITNSDENDITVLYTLTP